jgi:hypothetical protein
MALEIGADVVFKGLQSRADLNGLKGTVVSYQPSTKRFGVRVPKLETSLAVKRENLEVQDEAADPVAMGAQRIGADAAEPANVACESAAAATQEWASGFADGWHKAAQGAVKVEGGAKGVRSNTSPTVQWTVGGVSQTVGGETVLSVQQPCIGVDSDTDTSGAPMEGAKANALEASELAADAFAIALAVVPPEDWRRTLAAVLMLRKTSKRVKEIVDTVCPPEAVVAELGAAVRVMQQDVEEDLNEALPALESAVASLSNLSMHDIVEVRSFRNPPALVQTTMEAVCVLLGKLLSMRPSKKKRCEALPEYQAVGYEALRYTCIYIYSLRKETRLGRI